MKRKRTVNGSDLLQCVVKNGGKGEIVNLLQNQEFDFGDTDKNSNTVLHLIFENEKLTRKEILEVVEIFLNLGVDPNTVNTKQETPLHLAVARRLKDVVDILIKYNTKINVRDQEGNCITHFFIEDEYEKFKHILELKNDDLHFWYNDTTQMESANFVKWLMDRGFDFDASNKLGQSALDLAIDRNLLHILPVLLETTRDDNYLLNDCQSLFLSFIEKKYLVQPYYEQYFFHSMKILLDRRKKFVIVHNEDVQVIETLIDQFTKNCRGKDCAASLFHAIIRSCGSWNESTTEFHLQILRALIVKGVNVNILNDFGYRPLFFAVKEKSIPALEFLDENGADFNAKESNGQNLLGLLIRKDFGCEKSLQVFDFLVGKGCDVNETDHCGSSLLHLTSCLGNKELTKKLIEHGAEIDCRDNRMRTPLYYAMNGGFELLAKLLVENGANIHVKDGDGERLLFVAIRRRFRLPLKWGVELNTLHDVDDRANLEGVVANMGEASLEELLSYGLELNDSVFSRVLFEHCDSSNRELLIQHWIKLKAANLACSEEYQRHANIQAHQEFYQQCFVEIDKLKATFIDSHTSLYRFLHVDPNNRSVHINNEKLKELVDTPMLLKEFPKYAVVVSANYNEAVGRKSLLEPAIDAWMDLTQTYLPEICIERIIAFLTNVDLLRILGKH